MLLNINFCTYSILPPGEILERTEICPLANHLIETWKGRFIWPEKTSGSLVHSHSSQSPKPLFKQQDKRNRQAQAQDIQGIRKKKYSFHFMIPNFIVTIGTFFTDTLYRLCSPRCIGIFINCGRKIFLSVHLNKSIVTLCFYQNNDSSFFDVD